MLGSSSNLPPKMAFTFLVSLVAMSLLFATLCSYELLAKRTRMLLKARSRTLGFPGSSATARSVPARDRPASIATPTPAPAPASLASTPPR